ncbi:MAG: hypothetical protein E6K32_18675 [Gammaproteobacteria bacterium]|nr:MAG: hypothetical protein E6K32_18675 [Gammaproteobacteria bacterium]
MPDTLASLRGPVSCRRGAAPLGLTLIGETSEHPGERTELAFSAAAPADFPEALEGAVIERVGTHQYRIASAPREWLIEATAVHVHRDIAVPFYRAIPPRRVPLAKRIFWRVVLALAATRTGLALLRRLRR